MPYIPEKRRELLDPEIDAIDIEINDGELNYTITRICHRWIIDRGLKYFVLARVMGCLICVMFELYRMVVAPYEKKKRMLNGPVSDLDAKSLEDVR